MIKSLVIGLVFLLFKLNRLILHKCCRVFKLFNKMNKFKYCLYIVKWTKFGENFPYFYIYIEINQTCLNVADLSTLKNGDNFF